MEILEQLHHHHKEVNSKEANRVDNKEDKDIYMLLKQNRKLLKEWSNLDLIKEMLLRPILVVIKMKI